MPVARLGLEKVSSATVPKSIAITEAGVPPPPGPEPGPGGGPVPIRLHTIVYTPPPAGIVNL